MGRGRGSDRTAKDKGCPAESPLACSARARKRHHTFPQPGHSSATALLGAAKSGARPSAGGVPCVRA
eukprot:scaffold12630_cov118-Isochrysis_galbana.AAC.6